MFYYRGVYMKFPFIRPDNYDVPHVDLHIHTIYTDGSNTISEILQEAMLKNMETIAITDHVWKTSTYLDQYFSEIKTKRESIALKVLAGIEAKIININGDIDATSDIIDESEIVLGSLHSIPTDKDYAFLDPNKSEDDEVINNSFEALINLIESKRADVIAHPTASLKKYGYKDFYTWQIEEIASKAAKYDVAIEINVKYKVPSLKFIKICVNRGVPFSLGSDAHTLKEIGNINYLHISEIINNIG